MRETNCVTARPSPDLETEDQAGGAWERLGKEERVDRVPGIWWTCGAKRGGEGPGRQRGLRVGELFSRVYAGCEREVEGLSLFAARHLAALDCEQASKHRASRQV